VVIAIRRLQTEEVQRKEACLASFLYFDVEPWTPACRFIAQGKLSFARFAEDWWESFLR
jgi:hypothetical protein